MQIIIYSVFAAIISQLVCGMVTAPFGYSVSTEHQRYLAMHLALPEWQCLVTIHIVCTGCLLSQNSAGYLRYSIMIMIVNQSSMHFGLVSQVIEMSFGSSQV
jgi:hypothetical protein